MTTPLFVAFAIHDVAPDTWPECQRLLALVDERGAGPVTLLVIPQRHGRAPAGRSPAFVAALERRLARGDELALHGYYHRDTGPSPRTLRQFVERRVMTRGEGEFAALDEDEAAFRIGLGVELFDRLGWPLYGFVPPAWLLNDAGRRAIDRFGARFRYASTRRFIHRLPSWTATATANLCYSPDRPWRRAMSRAMIAVALARARHCPLLRMSMHPQDARSAEVLAHWRLLIDGACETRRAVTKREWIALDVAAAAIRGAAAGAIPRPSHGAEPEAAERRPPMRSPR